MTQLAETAIGRFSLPGILAVPDSPKGCVIFAHGSGSSRFSPRNRYAADYFAQLGFASLLFDLLTEMEARDRRNVFDIALLAARVVDAIDFVRADERTCMLPIGLFGASTGAGAAIVAGAARPHEVSAIVSRGGRPDLAGESLRAVRAPTLLIVGGADHDVLGLNRSARGLMGCETSLVVVPGAGHLFEEEGAMEKALKAAGSWFDQHLRLRLNPESERA